MLKSQNFILFEEYEKILNAMQRGNTLFWDFTCSYDKYLLVLMLRGQ